MGAGRLCFSDISSQLVYNRFVEQSFSFHLQTARSLMGGGRYRDAFDLIVDRDVQSLTELLSKIECLIDIGFILRDEKILRYGLYLLETHGSEVLEVRDLAPVYFLNLANQYANMVTLSSYDDEYYGYFTRSEQVRARELYEKALSYEHISSDLSFRIHLGLARTLHGAGRGLEALEHYQTALRLDPGSREVRDGKIRLMTEYAGLNGTNSRILYREAWHLIDSAGEHPGEDETLEHRRKLLERESDRAWLEEEEEYPLHTLVTESEEEHFYTMFALKYGFYLNICGFCRKCDFAAGDQARLSSSLLTIRQNQKKRFFSLSALYSRMKELYGTGRYLLTDAVTGERKRGYAETADEAPALEGYESGPLSYHLLRNAYLFGWSLWDTCAAYVALYWDTPLEEPPSMERLFFRSGSIKPEWTGRHSPSLHAVFDLYCDCVTGSRKHLKATEAALKRPWKMVDGELPSEELLRKQAIELYQVLKYIVLYMGIMHERNEFSAGAWSGPRPLYNFVKPGNDIAQE